VDAFKPIPGTTTTARLRLSYSSSLIRLSVHEQLGPAEDVDKTLPPELAKASRLILPIKTSTTKFFSEKEENKVNSTNNLKSKIFHVATDDWSLLTEYRTRMRRIEANNATPEQVWEYNTTYEFADGQRVSLEATSMDEVVFPASEGFDELVFERPQNCDPQTFDIAGRIRRTPVIGWRIKDDGRQTRAYPIAPYDEPHSVYLSDYAVTTPNGQVIGGRPYAESYDSVDAWIAAIRERWAEDLRASERLAKESQPCGHCGRGSGRDVDHFDDDIPF
jgi:hypothetical protein